MMSEGLFLIGAGGHAKVVLRIAREAGLAVAGVLDGNSAKLGTSLLDTAVTAPLPLEEWWRAVPRAAHLAIGDNFTRHRLSTALDAQWTRVIAPSAIVDETASIADGCLIATRAVIHPDSIIGAHTIVNTATVVEHDCRVGNYVHLAPMSCLAGGSWVGDGAFVAMGARVLPGIRVGVGAVVGAGAVVIRDVPDGGRVAGVPARPLGRTAPRA
ncbi:MAG: NeuD/PglB/VioB family sugar acetyltransferase [Terriglobia bacterium]|nr:NeuD/PglB/VioB family sugar acetyltransferase [Terriglobia bacterium]